MTYQNTEQEIQKLVNFYKNLSFNIFKFFWLFLTFLLSIILVFKIDFNKTFAIYNDKKVNLNFLICRKDICYSNLVWDGEKKINSFKIKFLDEWYIYNSWSNFEYKNGVVTFNKIILPYKVSVSSDKLKRINLKKFDTIENLKNFFEIIFYGKNSYDFYVKNKWNLLKADIWTYYNLTCIDKVKLTPYFCNKVVEKFLTNWYRVDLIYWKNLEYIQKLLKNYDKNKVCKFLENYIKKNKFFNDRFFSILKKCSNFNRYKKWKFYDEIINTFENKAVFLSKWWVLYNDKEIDVFKLYSFWKYFIDRLDHIDDYKDEIETYISFLYKFVDRYYENKDLMNQIYYFNNNILKTNLHNQAIKDTIEDFNNDDTQYLNADKLIKLISSNLINQTTSHISFYSPTTVEEIFKSYISTYYKDKIIPLRKIAEKWNILIYKVLINLVYINWKDKEEKTWEWIVKILFKDNNFYIIAAKWEKESKKYDEFIKSFLKNNKRVSITAFYEKLKDVLQYKETKKEKFCDKLSKEKLPKQFSLATCKEWNNRIKLSLEFSDKISKKKWYYDIIWLKNKHKVVIYTNNLLFKEHYHLKNVKLTRDKIVYIKSGINTETKLLKLVKQLLSLRFKLQEGVDIPTLLYFKISDKLKRYLKWQIVKIISYDNEKIKLIVNVNNVDMLAEIDLKDNYHLKVLALTIQRNEDTKHITVKWIDFYLIQKDYEKLNQFRISPVEYIKQYDPDAIEKYEKLLKNK